MHVVDIIVAVAAGLLVVLFAAVLARQRYMLRVAGGVPVAVRVRGNRWVYGIARYAGGDLRWYRGIGVGTKPTTVLHRDQLRVLTHRAPLPAELPSLPATSIVVECSYGDTTAVFGFSEGAYTGFISWLEASAPRS